MLSQNKLNSFEEVKRKKEEDIYYPGLIDGFFPLFNPFSEEEIKEMSSSKDWIQYSRDWVQPKKVKGIPGDLLPRYKTGTSFRRWGKERIGKRLKMLPSPHQEVQSEYSEQLTEIPTFPRVFLDGVPQYGEIPFRTTARSSFGQEPERGEWGQLISAVAESGKMLLGLRAARYQARVARAQAEREKEKEISWIKYLPYVLLGVGGALLLGGRKGGR